MVEYVTKLKWWDSQMHMSSFVSQASQPFCGKRFTPCFLGTVLLLCMSACASRPWYDAPPPMPVPLSPEVKAELGTPTAVEFVWSRTGQTEGYDFHVFNGVTTDIDQYMLRNLQPEQICAGDTCRVRVPLALPASKRHAWRVRSYNNAGRSAWTRHLFTWGTPTQ